MEVSVLMTMFAPPERMDLSFKYEGLILKIVLSAVLGLFLPFNDKRT